MFAAGLRAQRFNRHLTSQSDLFLGVGATTSWQRLGAFAGIWRS